MAQFLRQNSARGVLSAVILSGRRCGTEARLHTSTVSQQDRSAAGIDQNMLSREADEFNAEMTNVFGQDVSAFDSSAPKSLPSRNNMDYLKMDSAMTSTEPVVRLGPATESLSPAVHVHLEKISRDGMQFLVERELKVRVKIKKERNQALRTATSAKASSLPERESIQLIPSAVHLHLSHMSGTELYDLSWSGLRLSIDVRLEE